MRAHVFQHVPFEGPGAIEDLLRRKGVPLSRTRFFAGERVPAADQIDFLIVLGGPMSIHDLAEHPWLENEVRILRAFLASGRPVLGICLGAQLIAHALGAEVTRNPQPEIGWFPVHATAAAEKLGFPPEFTAFHWHGETFALPAGATSLGRSAACDRQGFCVGDNVVGLQFHIESTPETCRALVEHCAEELVDAPFVQTAGEILAADDTTFATMHGILERLLDRLPASS